jgi:hypothetical protein
MKSKLVLVALAIGVVGLEGLASQGTVQAATPNPLSSADVAKVQKIGFLLSTQPGTKVKAAKGRGRDVWVKFNPDVKNIDTDSVLDRELIVVRSAANVPQGLDDPMPGTTTPKMVAVSVILDATDGRVLEISGEAAGARGTRDPADLGAMADVVLNDVTPPGR